MRDRWADATVAPEGTHHNLDGRPLYVARFSEVLKFHAPGLAPVRDGSGAFHIDGRGEPAYGRRFRRSFGFYEGLAAVDSAAGWHHIDDKGQDAYRERWDWCGNFQGGRCTVRAEDGRYGHIRPDGGLVVGLRWRYAGDYRDGVAVVQGEDGRSTHITADGSFLHGSCFEDLDVFHKGYARARDAAGWMHVDGAGRPIYAARFASVEPFYNGQARAERWDGALEVIDETGRSLVTLRPPRRSEFAALSADLVGFWRTDAIAGAVAMGLFEALPGSTAALADRLNAPPERLGALLRALGELCLLQRAGGVWSATARGALLQRDHPLTLADAALEYADPMRGLWQRMPGALQDPAWQPPDIFKDVAGDAARLPAHHRMLQSYARHDYPGVPAALALRGDERVLDVGGGVGVLAELLLDRHPDLQVTVLDLPPVVALLPQRPGLTGLAADLFAHWGTTAEVVVLARVLHDWPDDRALELLERVRRALPQGGRVFVVELLVADDGSVGGLCDLHLLLATGGRERTAEAYAALLDRAGFDLVAIRPSGGLPMVLEGVAR